MISDDRLTLFITSAPPGQRELRLSLVQEHLELDAAEFKRWLRQRTTDQLRLAVRTATDEDLITLYQTFDDHEAFTEVLQRYDGYITNLLGRYLRTPDAVDEVLQVYRCTMMQTAMNRFKFDSKFRTYAHRVAVNEALMYLREQRRLRLDDNEVALNTAEADPHPHEDHLIQARIHEAVAKLPEHLRHAFMARHLRHLNIQEGSAALGISPALFRQRIHRARLQLRGMLNDLR